MHLLSLGLLLILATQLKHISGCSVSCCTPLNGIAKLGEANDGQNVLTLRQKDENNSFVRPVYERNITLRSKCPLDLQSVTFEFLGVCNVKLTLLSENGTLDPVDVLTKDYRSENGTLIVRHNFSIHAQQTWKTLLKSSKPGDVIIIRITLSQINGCWIAPVLNKAKRGWSITGRDTTCVATTDTSYGTTPFKPTDSVSQSQASVTKIHSHTRPALSWDSSVVSPSHTSRTLYATTIVPPGHTEKREKEDSIVLLIILPLVLVLMVLVIVLVLCKRVHDGKLSRSMMYFWLSTLCSGCRQLTCGEGRESVTSAEKATARQKESASHAKLTSSCDNKFYSVVMEDLSDASAVKCQQTIPSAIESQQMHFQSTITTGNISDYDQPVISQGESKLSVDRAVATADTTSAEQSGIGSVPIVRNSNTSTGHSYVNHDMVKGVYSAVTHSDENHDLAQGEPSGTGRSYGNNELAEGESSGTGHSYENHRKVKEDSSRADVAESGQPSAQTKLDQADQAEEQANHSIKLTSTTLREPVTYSMPVKGTGATDISIRHYTTDDVKPPSTSSAPGTKTQASGVSTPRPYHLRKASSSSTQPSGSSTCTIPASVKPDRTHTSLYQDPADLIRVSRVDAAAAVPANPVPSTHFSESSEYASPYELRAKMEAQRSASDACTASLVGKRSWTRGNSGKGGSIRSIQHPYQNTDPQKSRKNLKKGFK